MKYTARQWRDLKAKQDEYEALMAQAIQAREAKKPMPNPPQPPKNIVLHMVDETGKEVMTATKTQPPSPAQRIEAAILRLYPSATVWIGHPPQEIAKLNACLSTVQTAIREMESEKSTAYEKGKAHGFHEGNNFKFMQDAEDETIPDDAALVEQLEARVRELEAERARAVAAIEGLKKSGIDVETDNGAVETLAPCCYTIDACVKILKGDQA